MLSDPAVGAVASLLSIAALFPSFLQPNQSQYQGSGSSYLGQRRSLLWVVLGRERAVMQLPVGLSRLQLGELPSLPGGWGGERLALAVLPYLRGALSPVLPINHLQ